jgi:hypothetical protein
VKQTTYNFKDRFVSQVEGGTKTSTIRLFEKTTPPNKGDRLKLFKGQRTPHCRRIKLVTCQDCLPIQITDQDITLNGRQLDSQEQYQLAVGDGFENAPAMRAFFKQTYGLPLPGNPHLVSWKIN